jgi:glycosyltransferase involved in cell wall biosynthesis
MTEFTQRDSNNNARQGKIRILIACTWPLGGIRTFLKYNYRHFPKNQFDITVLAIPTIERAAVEKDLKVAGIPVIWSKPWLGRNFLFARVAALLWRSKFDCIHSQGFTAAFHVAVVNYFFRIPHVLTMHGILEPKYFQGWSGPLKRFIFRRVLSNVSVFHAVSQDMLDHFRSEMPQLKTGPSHYVVIRNGIDVDRFQTAAPSDRRELRELLGCPNETFVFGYFGRFMPEKGFDLLVKATENLTKESDSPAGFRVLAMGSGDYEPWAKTLVKRACLDEIIRFYPFSPDVDRFIKGCDAVVMPSRHEAWGLLACEALVAGIPVIASDAIGLREAVRDTPALVFTVGDARALASTMRSVLLDQSIQVRFVAYKTTAADRYDVRNSAAQLVELFEELTRGVTASP